MIIVAKISQEVAQFIAGELSIDNIRYFNPVSDILGNNLMDLQMAEDNGILYDEFYLDESYYDELRKAEEALNPQQSNI